MRVFVAVDIEVAIRDALGALQSELREKTGFKKSDVKWVNTDNMHLTLKFLGEIKDTESVEVCNRARQAAERHNAFDLQIEKVGFFGGRTARVLWVGAGDGSEKLIAIQKDIEQFLAEAGYAPESREFSPHLTLCRVRNPRAGRRLANISCDYEQLKLGPARIDSVVVYQSELTPKGPLYTALGRYDLRTT